MGFAALAVAAIAGAAAASMQKTPKLPNPAPPPPPPQAAQLPTAMDQRAGVMGAGQSGGSPGAAQTMLTGAGGVDPDQLKLGKSTLLGGG